MQRTWNQRFVAGFLLAGSLVLSPMGARAENANPTDPLVHPTSAPARSKEKIMADLNAAMREIREVMGTKGESAFADAKTRQEVAPKAIPAIKKYLAVFDEVTEQEPRAKEQSASVHAQFLSMMTALGDAESEKKLVGMSEGKGDDAIGAKMSLLTANWWKNSTDAAAQKKILDQATTLLKDNPKNDGITRSIIDMSDVGAATPELRESAEKVVVENAKGEQAQGIIEQIKALQKLKSMEGKPLALAGTLNDGKQFTSADWKGKVILVDFWATWCGPCRAELPRVKKAYADFHPKGLEVLGVSCDNAGADLKKFLAENPDMPWPQLFDEKTAGWHPLAKEFGISGIPTMFLIDKKGLVRTVEARESFEDLIPKMLAE